MKFVSPFFYFVQHYKIRFIIKSKVKLYLWKNYDTFEDLKKLLRKIYIYMLLYIFFSKSFFGREKF